MAASYSMFGLAAALLCVASCGAPQVRRNSRSTPGLPATEATMINTSAQPYPCLKVRDAAIKIDGVADERVWCRATPITTFSNSADHTTTARCSTTARLLWSDHYLFFSAVCITDAINAVVTQRDGPVYNEETAEVFLCPLGAEKPYYEFEFNPLGGIYDSHLQDYHEELADRYRFEWACAYSAAIRSATRVLRGVKGQITGWTLEAAIPLEDLRVPGQPRVKAGDTWPFNVYRNAIAADGTLEQSHWKAVESTFHDPLHFAQMVFMEKP